MLKKTTLLNYMLQHPSDKVDMMRYSCSGHYGLWYKYDPDNHYPSHILVKVYQHGILSNSLRVLGVRSLVMDYRYLYALICLIEGVYDDIEEIGKGSNDGLCITLNINTL